MGFRARLKRFGLIQGRFRVDMIMRTMWLFLEIGGFFSGSPWNKSPTILGLYQRP